MAHNESNETEPEPEKMKKNQKQNRLDRNKSCDNDSSLFNRNSSESINAGDEIFIYVHTRKTNIPPENCMQHKSNKR